MQQLHGRVAWLCACSVSPIMCRTEAAQPPQEWTPLFTPVEANPVRVVEEQVVDDPQVAEYVGKLKDAELLVKRAEHGLRFSACAVRGSSC